MKRVILTYFSHTTSLPSEEIIKKFRELTSALHSETEALYLLDEELFKMAELPFTRISHLSSPSHTALHRHSIKRQLYLQAQNLREKTARAFLSQTEPEFRFTVTDLHQFRQFCREISREELLALGPLPNPIPPTFQNLLKKLIDDYRGPLLLFDSSGLLSPHIVLLHWEQPGETALSLALSLVETFERYVFTAIVQAKNYENTLRNLLKKFREKFPKFKRESLEIYKYSSLNSLLQHLPIWRGSTLIIPSSHPLLDRLSPLQLFQQLRSPILII